MNKSTTKVSLSRAVADYSSTGNYKDLIEYVETSAGGSTKTEYMRLLLANMLKEVSPRMKTTVANYYIKGKILRQDCDTAVHMYIQASNEGDVHASFVTGVLAFNGGNYEKAVCLLGDCINRIEEFEAEDSCEIYNRYATACLRQKDKDIDEAIRYFEIATEKFLSPFAAKNLYCLFSDSEDSERYNKQKACKYILIAAEGGDMDACTVAGELYLKGDEEVGVSKNVEKAYSLVSGFSGSDDFSINYLLGRIYLLLTCENEKYDLLEYSEKAKEQLEKAWQKKKTAHIADLLSRIYINVTGEREKALELLLYLEKNSNTSRIEDIANLYYQLGDYENAMAYFGKILSENIINEECLKAVFSILSNPRYGSAGVSKMCALLEKYSSECKAKGEFQDISVVLYVAQRVLESNEPHKMTKNEAAEYMEIAVMKDYDKKQNAFYLGKYYQQSQNYRGAEKYYLEAFNSGNADAGAYLAHLYEEGGGSIVRNFDFALDWYTKAAQAGSSIAAKEKDRFTQVVRGLFKNRLVVERIEVTSYEY